MTAHKGGLLPCYLGLALLMTCQFARGAVEEGFSWGANFGWMNWRSEGTSGAVLNERIASGWIYSANVGWISLGDGSPADGNQYSNATADDFGVNVDSVSDLKSCILSGY